MNIQLFFFFLFFFNRFFTPSKATKMLPGVKENETTFGGAGNPILKKGINLLFKRLAGHEKNIFLYILLQIHCNFIKQ